ncbi:hypothetical protein CHU98_g10771 [Xylaria longipes]|nr:hypothetical protein CHU98_g10771 [Xylaria longipes]
MLVDEPKPETFASPRILARLPRPVRGSRNKLIPHVVPVLTKAFRNDPVFNNFMGALSEEQRKDYLPLLLTELLKAIKANGYKRVLVEYGTAVREEGVYKELLEIGGNITQSVPVFYEGAPAPRSDLTLVLWFLNPTYLLTTIYLFGGAAIAQQQAWAQFNIPSSFRTAWVYSRILSNVFLVSQLQDVIYDAYNGCGYDNRSIYDSVNSGTTTTTTAGSGVYPMTLQSGYYWVQAVASPNFHSYLQAAPTVTSSPGPGDAYLRPAQNAGQFNIVDGQLENNPGSSGGGMPYIRVEDPTDKTQRTLQTWFDTTENPYGKFAFQGDTLTWTVADISRPHAGAWLVCGNDGQLYINAGAYAYDTPSGCVDQTWPDYFEVSSAAWFRGKRIFNDPTTAWASD